MPRYSIERKASVLGECQGRCHMIQAASFRKFSAGMGFNTPALFSAVILGAKKYF